MARVIEITESKVDKMSNLVEDMLLAGGELMHCLTKLSDEMYGERGGGDYGNGYGNRYGSMSGERMPMRDNGDWNEADEMRRMIGERRKRRGMR